MKIKWKILACLLFIFFAGGVLVWWAMLGNICTSPSSPTTVSLNIVQYNCHGKIVFITPIQDALLNWLVPVEMIVGVCFNWVSKRL
jgi:hypothetical protein